MQHVASESQAAPAEVREEVKNTLFGTAGLMLPLLTTLHAGGVMVLLQKIEHPTIETQIGVGVVFAASLIMAAGQDIEIYLRRRFSRKAPEAA